MNFGHKPSFASPKQFLVATVKILAKNCIGYNGQKSFRKFRKILDIGVFYMSSISAMGPHFFHWKNKLWVRGGRSRLALSENIGFFFFRLSKTGSCPQNLPT